MSDVIAKRVNCGDEVSVKLTITGNTRTEFIVYFQGPGQAAAEKVYDSNATEEVEQNCTINFKDKIKPGPNVINVRFTNIYRKGVTGSNEVELLLRGKPEGDKTTQLVDDPEKFPVVYPVLILLEAT